MTAINAQGAIVSFHATTVGGVTSFSGPSGSAADIDVTTLASTAKEFRQGLKDLGEISFNLIRDPANAGQLAMQTALDGQLVREVIITLISGDILTFSAYVKGITTEAAADGVVTGVATLRITGDAVWT